jgi:Tfp pilus assembly protein PilN
VRRWGEADVQSVDLNLASRPFKNDTLPWVGLVVAVLLLGFASWHNVNTWFQNRTMLTDLEQRQATIDRRLDELERRGGDAVRRIDKINLPALSTRSGKANEVIRWKSFSWTRLFNMLEEVQPANVQLTSIHPVFRGERGRVKDDVEDLEQVPVSVEGIAKDLRAFLEFERALIGSSHFDRIDPGTLATDDNTGERIFRMRFLYDPRIVEPPPETEEAAADEQGGTLPAETAPEAAEEQATRTDVGNEAVLPGAAADSAPSDTILGEDDALPSGKLEKIKRRGNRKKRGAGAGADKNAAATAPAPADAAVQTPEAQPVVPTELLPAREAGPDWGARARPLGAADDADEGED